MLKFFKYIYLLNIYKKAKTNVVVFFTSFLVLIFGVMILSDFIELSKTESVYMYLIFKWALILFVVSVMFFNVVKIIEVAVDPFNYKTDNMTDNKTDERKKRILEKEKLTTKSEQIIKKYQAKVL